jgi:membrane protein DedA with SNARE-associated domain
MTMWDLPSELFHRPLGMILLGLAVTQLGLPLPETVFIVAAGVVSERDGLPVALPIVACSVAVLLGDLALFFLARYLGPPAFRRRPLRWLLPSPALPRIDALFARHGSMAIFVARFVSGVRAATFVLAGMRGVRVARFVIWDGLAVLVTVPVFALLGFYFSARLDELALQIRHANYAIVALLLGVLVTYWLATMLRRRRAGTAAK